ncbi:hypothetical protein CRUP_000571 [Coryphaenoides rupestris]|nr:hypothetical protein CRUP_000571 [Coryphaenoides rupestris]
MSAAAEAKRKQYMTVKDLQKVLDSCDLQLHQVDEVWPNIYIGNVGAVSIKMSAAAEAKRKQYMTVKDLQKVLDSCDLQLHQVDEVWPNIYIGNVHIAQNRSALQKLGITHVLNAAHSKRGSIGNQRFYGSDIVYCGIPADDSAHFDMDVYFKPAADFIHKALNATAKDKDLLGALGVTHVLNAADGPNHIDTGACFYGDTDIVYYGVAAADHKGFDLSPFFGPVSEFIRDGLAQNGKVLVHCIMGLSRSSTLVLAYLMIHRRLSLRRALKRLLEKRAIYPNRNFLALLLDLDLQLKRRKRTSKVLVHCVMGQSRSSTLVLAYLMIHQNLTLADAVRAFCYAE